MKQSPEILVKLPVPYEPKRKNRWIISLPEAFDLPSFTIISTSRPSFKFQNSTVEAQPITIKFRDPIGPSTAQAFWNLIAGLTDLPYVDEYIKKSMQEKLVDFKDGFDYGLELLDPMGVVIERWEIKGCVIKEMSFDDLDYISSDFVSCSMVIQPKTAKLLF